MDLCEQTFFFGGGGEGFSLYEQKYKTIPNNWILPFYHLVSSERVNVRLQIFISDYNISMPANH